MNTEAIAKAISIVGSQKALADALGCRQPFVNKMLKTGRVPAERCLPIERITNGAVTRYELRPDVFGESPAHAESGEAA